MASEHVRPTGVVPLDPPPPEVASAAGQREFGPLLASRVLLSHRTGFWIYLAGGVACIALEMALATWVAKETGTAAYSPLRSTARVFIWPLCPLGVVLIVKAVRAFRFGTRAYWAYGNGIVLQRNGAVQAYGWYELLALRPFIGRRGDNAGRVLHYELLVPGGPPVVLPLVVQDGRDPFMDQVIAGLARYGKPVG